MSLWKNEVRATEPLSGYYNACAYPHVTPEMFQGSVQVSMSTGMMNPIADVSLFTAAFSKLLPGSQIQLPAYDVHITDQPDPLRDRVAMIGIGSHCSPFVLFEKFRRAGIGGSFITAQALLTDHAVVHGAFIGARGTVPATVIPDRRTTTHLTVSLLTMEQAEALTVTEPNYDLVLTAECLQLYKMAGNPILRGGALMYVSIWGALPSEPGSQEAIALDAIPSVTPLKKMTGQQIVHHVAGKLGHSVDAEAFFNTLPGLPLEERIPLLRALQQDAIPATIRGQQVKPSATGQAIETLGFIPPQIQYLK